MRTRKITTVAILAFFGLVGAMPIGAPSSALAQQKHHETLANSPFANDRPIVHKDRDGQYLTGDHNYRLHLPPNIPAKLCWSVTVYDAANSSGLENGHPFPSRGSRDKPVLNADGSVDLYFGDMAPAGKEKNWLRTNL
jgi:hypothetical protein